MDRLRRVTSGMVCAAAVCLTAQAGPSKFTVPSGGSGCFDFAGLNVGDEYRVGDRVQTRYGPVELVDYSVNETTPTPTNQNAIRATVDSSSIAGSGPEIRFYLISANFEPDRPLRRVTFDVAENWAGGVASGAHHNLGVNGETLEVSDTLESIDGQEIGDDALGKVVVNVDMSGPDPDSNWVTGTVVLKPINGATINDVRWGGRQVKIDNVCFEAA